MRIRVQIIIFRILIKISFVKMEFLTAISFLYIHTYIDLACTDETFIKLTQNC